jgi:hypothetical protein
VGNKAYSDNTLVAAVVNALAEKLPRSWRTAIAAPPKRDWAPGGLVDAIVTIRRPGAPVGRLFIEAKTRLEPKDVDYLAAPSVRAPSEPFSSPLPLSANVLGGVVTVRDANLHYGLSGRSATR